MIEVTDAAREALHEMILRSLPDHPDPGNLGFRLVRCEQPTGEDSVGLAIDEARPGDEVVEHENQTVLILNGAAADALDGRTLDLVETGLGQRLTIR